MAVCGSARGCELTKKELLSICRYVEILYKANRELLVLVVLVVFCFR